MNMARTNRLLSFAGLIFLFISTRSQAQITAGTATASPEATALLDLASTHKGLLVPRLTAAQRLAIANPANALLVYDLDSLRYFFYRTPAPAGWVSLGKTGAQGAVGAQGAPGLTGATGAQGPQGAQGPTGAQGTQGIQGARGAANIASYSAAGTSDASAPVSPNFGAMPQMSVTLTPKNATVYAHFAAGGTYVSNDMNEHGVYFELLNGSTVIKRFDCTAAEDLNLWNIAFSYPITVTPNVATTISIRWASEEVSGNAATTPVYNNVGSQSYAHRSLLVHDRP